MRVGVVKLRCYRRILVSIERVGGCSGGSAVVGSLYVRIAGRSTTIFPIYRWTELPFCHPVKNGIYSYTIVVAYLPLAIHVTSVDDTVKSSLSFFASARKARLLCP